MNRKQFLKQSLIGAGLIVQASTLLIPNLLSTTPMKNIILHKANTRGFANHGWLQANHSFSFASYHNPERMNFGVLRVLNDDSVAGGMGFGKHPHDNMEIITIPLEGALEHKDSMGNSAVIHHGEVQVMSAGTGIFHSEMNKNRDTPVKLLQIWVMPNKRQVEPRYQQIMLNVADRHNRLQQILSPSAEDEGVWIHQDAWFHLGALDKDFQTTYQLKKKGNGVYAFVIKGDLTIAGQTLESRDALGIWDVESLDIQANTEAEILLLEVPMTL